MAARWRLQFAVLVDETTASTLEREGVKAVSREELS
jgi:hypothetical protein